MPKENKILIPPEIFVIMQYTLRELCKTVFCGLFVFALIGIGVRRLSAIWRLLKPCGGNFAACRRVSLLCRVCHGDCSHFHYRAEFNDKCLVLYLSLPISRAIYFVGKLAGFYIAGIIVAFIFSLIMAYYADFPRALLWFSSLAAKLF